MTTENNASITTREPFSDPSRPIVVGVDGSKTSLAALRHAARLAPVLGLSLNAVALWDYPTSIYDVYEPTPDWSPEFDARKVLDEAAQTVFGDEAPDWFSSEVLRGTPARVLIEESKGASMLVLGSRGLGGFTGMLLGSVSRTVSAHAACPVLIVHADTAQTDSAETDSA
ncbi:universal stress protein [Homoserinimonas sp. OAct 916]|uniref:universal stress protein n=1 Tax=Homoserinimonas sp. OAct 916 TaxID=2211450 RepID=UPI000DBE100B|nr:universal stress protein [Homoserinimonas sp. OAct 916]